MATKTTATKKATTTKKSTTVKTATKSTASKPKKPAWKGNADLFVKLEGKELTPTLQFKSQASPIYNVEEFVWKGKLPVQGKVSFVRANGSEVPVHEDTNHGFCLVGNAMKYFDCSNSLVIPSELGDCIYVYITKSSYLKYIGDSKEHSLYIRIYDNANGNYNDRWVTISID